MVQSSFIKFGAVVHGSTGIDSGVGSRFGCIMMMMMTPSQRIPSNRTMNGVGTIPSAVLSRYYWWWR
jgi:hypothetical protein